MDVAVQHHGITRVGQQIARRRIGFGQKSALAARSRRESLEPARQGHKLRRRSAPRYMQPAGDRTQDAARLVVVAGRDHCGQSARTGDAFQQERPIVARQDARRTVAVPPRHQPAATALFFLADLRIGECAGAGRTLILS